MMRPETKKELSQIIAEVEGKLASLPTFTWEKRSEHTRALDRVVAELERDGAKFGHVSDHTTVTLAGIRSSSTMGAQYALRNWVAAARRAMGGAS